MWPLFLSHHSAEDADRCLQVGSVHLCRRCTALWPFCIAVLVYLIVTRAPVASGTAIAAWLAAPVAEFTAVHLGWLKYSIGRVWVLSLAAGMGAALLFYRYMLDPSDKTPWLLAMAFGLPAAAAAVYHEMGKNPKVL
ncbi:MAG: hypothetical protein VXW32_15610 [Myxococcota bacterium]|nr:hypothetical protein [Myxococcota bacterium]